MVIEFFKRIWHQILHWTGDNTGNIISYNEGDFICVAFECSCGKIDPSSIVKITESELDYGNKHTTN